MLENDRLPPSRLVNLYASLLVVVSVGAVIWRLLPSPVDHLAFGTATAVRSWSYIGQSLTAGDRGDEWVGVEAGKCARIDPEPNPAPLIWNRVDVAAKVLVVDQANGVTWMDWIYGSGNRTTFEPVEHGLFGQHTHLFLEREEPVISVCCDTACFAQADVSMYWTDTNFATAHNVALDFE
jgi:hypothetical protein